MASSLNKTQTKHSPVLKPQKQQQSIGVGDYYANPSRQVMEWMALYYEGKFYLTDPRTYQRIQQVQAQLDLEKKLVSQYAGSEREKAETVRGIDPKLQTSGYSYATEHDAQKCKLKQLKAEKDLHKQEEMNFKRIVQAKHKKKIQKRQVSKNLIQVKKHKKEDVLSEKDHGQKAREVDEDVLNQTMMNKLQIPKNARQLTPVKAVEQQKFQQQSPILNSQSVINIKTTEYNPNRQDLIESQNNKHIKLSIIDPNSYCQKIVIPLPESGIRAQDRNQQHLKIISDQSFKDNQSLILNKISINQPESKQKDPSILDIGSEEQHQLDKYIQNNARAGSSFFSQINKNLDTIGNSGNPEAKEKRQTKAPQDEVKREGYHPTQTIRQTQNILQVLDDHFKMLESGQQGIEEHSQQPLKTPPVEQLTSKQGAQSPCLKHAQTKLLQTQEQAIKKKKQFRVTSSLVNYQISNQIIRKQENVQSEEKQRLQKEIGILQQVIGQLRVQRLKYQASQIEMNTDKNTESAFYSHFDKSQRDPYERRFDETPGLFNKTHRPAGTHLTNFQESVVSQFQSGTRSNLVRTKSGKIVRNRSTDKKTMPQIQEQHLKEDKSKQIKAKVSSESPKKHDLSIQVEQTQKISGHTAIVPLQEKEASKIAQENQNTSSPVTHQKPDSKETKTKEHYKFKITNKDNRKRQTISEHKDNTLNHMISGSVIIRGDTPLPNKSRVSKAQDSDMESSMPRRLINKYNFSMPPKITVEEQVRHKKMAQQSAQKKLLNNFTKMQRQSARKPPPSQEGLDPKRRALREGMLKNLETKTICNPQSGKKQTSRTNLRQRASQVEPSNRSKYGSQVRNQSKSVKNFRMRKQSQSSHQSSRNNNKSTKGREGKIKPEEKMMYVPAVQENIFNNDISQPINQSQFCEVRFDQLSKHNQPAPLQGFQLTKRTISFSNLSVPKLPEPPTPNITVEDMSQLIRKLCTALDESFENSQIHKIIMKKYKNCVMLDLPTSRSLKLVWHYNGKIYVGEWDEISMAKTGDGIEYTPDKYYYKGQFLNNKKNGTGTMLFHNGSRYEGQWKDGERSGKGKYQDSLSKYYYEGEWKESKKEGYGYLEIQDFSIFEGTFSNNHRSGRGTEKFYSGDSYQGQYEKGKFHGKGIYVWESGSSFEGRFVEGVKQGEGQWRSDTGEIFVGSYVKDKKNGFGRYRWENGTVYEGQFLNDKQHGKGVLKKNDGQEIRGIWDNGKLIQVLHVQQEQSPLQPKKSKTFETQTIIKVVQTKPQKISTPGNLSSV